MGCAGAEGCGIDGEPSAAVGDELVTATAAASAGVVAAWTDILPFDNKTAKINTNAARRCEARTVSPPLKRNIYVMKFDDDGRDG